MKNEPTPNDNTIDSRDLLELLEEKESEVEALFDTWLDEIVEEERESRLERDQPFTDEDEESFRGEQLSFEGWLEQSEDEEAEDLKALRDFIEEAEGYSGDSAKDGFTLINEDYFEKYAEEMAEDVCDMRRSSDWPFCHIDWEEAADDLKTDYSSVEWHGTEFWVRS